MYFKRGCRVKRRGSSNRKPRAGLLQAAEINLRRGLTFRVVCDKIKTVRKPICRCSSMVEH